MDLNFLEKRCKVINLFLLLQRTCPFQWLTSKNSLKSNKKIVFVGELSTSVPISRLRSEHVFPNSKSIECKKAGGAVVAGLIQLSELMKNCTQTHDNAVQELKDSVCSWVSY